MAPKIAHLAPKLFQKHVEGKHVEPTCSQGRFRIATGYHFGRLWDPLGAKMIDLGTPFAPKYWILISFSTDFGSLLPRTKQLDRKLQEHASKFKNMQTASLNKDASTKTPILNASSCTKRRSTSIIFRKANLD